MCQITLKSSCPPQRQFYLQLTLCLGLLGPQVVEQLRPLLFTAGAGPGFNSGCDNSGKRLFIQFIFEEMRHRQVTEANCWMLAGAEPA